MQKNKLALRLTESAIMIAAATILSMFKLVELPYGGSITLASMLPIVIIAYRYGTAWGILCRSRSRCDTAPARLGNALLRHRCRCPSLR